MHLIKKLPQSWTTVTPFSKNIALVLFVLLPLGAFLLGMFVQREKDGWMATALNEATLHEVDSSPAPTPILIDTATWKTYTNTEYHYSLKLPPEFVESSIPTRTASLNRMIFDDATLTGNYPNRKAKYGFSIQIGYDSDLDGSCKSDEECYLNVTDRYRNTVDGMKVMPIQTQIANRTVKGLAVSTTPDTLYYFYSIAEKRGEFAIAIQFYAPKGFENARLQEPYINAILSTLTIE